MPGGAAVADRPAPPAQGHAVSGTKWSPIPRVNPEYLARWENAFGYWRLVITNVRWELKDSAWTDVPVTEPHPDDSHLRKLGFVPAGDGGWAADGDAWERAVRPAYP